MLIYANTNIINGDKLKELIHLSTDIFRARGVYSGDLTYTAFRILAYWGLYHRDNIDDPILFLESCADKLSNEVELFDAAVLCMNPTVPNFIQVGFDYDEAPCLSNLLTEADYVLDPDLTLKLSQWSSIGRITPTPIAVGSYKLFLRINQIAKETGGVVDFKDFAKHA